MTCKTCPKAKPAQKCAAQLQIATTTLLSTAVYVYLESTSTGRIDRYAATTDGAGIVVIDTPEVATNSSYTIYVTDQTDTDQNNRATMTLDLDGTPTETDCYLLTFNNPQAGDYPLIEIVLQ